MNQAPNSDPQPAPAPRKKRRWLQLSMRSVLLLTTVAAVACWWWLRPRLAETNLLGGHVLRLDTIEEQPDPKGPKNKLDHGPVEVVDRHGRVEIRGFYNRNREAGLWWHYYPSGRLAMRGRCVDGRRTGVWTGWHENGRKKFVLEHGVKVYAGKGKPWLHASSSTKHLAPDNDQVVRFEEKTGVKLPRVAVRQGTVKAWWSNGRPRLEGQFQNDLAEGEWTYWSRDGVVVAKGRKKSGWRHGVWILREPPTGGEATVVYFEGRKYATVDALVVQMLETFDREAPGDQFTAIRMANELGDAGLPVMRRALRSDDVPLIKVVCHCLGERAAAAQPLTDDLRQLFERDDEVSFHAGLALFRILPEHRTKTLRQMLSWTSHQPRNRQADLLSLLGNGNSLDVLNALDALLVEPDRRVRHTAFQAVACFVIPAEGLWFAASYPPDYLRRLASIIDASIRRDDPVIASAAKTLKKSPFYSNLIDTHEAVTK